MMFIKIKYTGKVPFYFHEQSIIFRRIPVANL